MVGLSKEGRAVLVTDIPDTVSAEGTLIAGRPEDATDTIHAVVWRCE